MPVPQNQWSPPLQLYKVVDIKFILQTHTLKTHGRTGQKLQLSGASPSAIKGLARYIRSEAKTIGAHTT